MIRTTVLALALAGILSRGAFADDSANWTSTAGAATVKKALDIIAHGAEVRAITHDNKIYKGVYNPAPAIRATEWFPDRTLATGSSGNPGNNNCSWRLYDKVAVWPQLVSFGGALYACRMYMTVVEGPGGSCTNYMYPEYRVVKWDGVAETTVLQMGGAASTAWQCGADFRFYDPTRDTMVGGYLFTVGATLYWGGGGGKWINPVVLPSGPAAGINWGNYGSDFKYVYSTPDGVTWSRINAGAGRTLGNDEYNRAIPAAMPSGYRYSHIVELGGTLYDYYGTYTSAPPFTFTPYPAGSPQTEPWGWFLMGKDGSRVYRVAHNKKGDKNFVYAGNGGAWNTTWAAGSNAAPNDGSVYWRACAAISDNTNTVHNGLYCTYSQQAGANFESGVYRYSDPDGDGVSTWSKCISTNDARVYTGGIFIKKDEAIYVGTSNGILRRPINDVDQPNPGDPKSPPPS